MNIKWKNEFINILKEFKKIENCPEKYYLLGEINLLLLKNQIEDNEKKKSTA